MITAERRIDELAFTYHADGTLTIHSDKDGDTWLTDREMFCLLAFVKLENIAPRVARHERQRQKEEWEKIG